MKITLLKSKIHCANLTESDRFSPSVVPVRKDNSVKSTQLHPLICSKPAPTLDLSSLATNLVRHAG